MYSHQNKNNTPYSETETFSFNQQLKQGDAKGTDRLGIVSTFKT